MGRKIHKSKLLSSNWAYGEDELQVVLNDRYDEDAFYIIKSEEVEKVKKFLEEN